VTFRVFGSWGVIIDVVGGPIRVAACRVFVFAGIRKTSKLLRTRRISQGLARGKAPRRKRYRNKGD